jgi:regulator of replication initiation timing
MLAVGSPFPPVRIPVLFFTALLGFSPTSTLRAQDQGVQAGPGALQDEEAAREKLLKASDQLDNIQANSEATKTSVDGMKSDVAALQAAVTKLQTDNAALRQQLADTQAALDQFKTEQIKARQTLIDNVADMIASQDASSGKSTKKKKETPTTETPTAASGPVKTPDSQAAATSLAPPPDAAPSAPTASTPDDNDSIPPPPKPQKGYYHVVASGETLKLICEAYRENGVNVSVTAIRKANGLTDKSALKAGQKLFIPKPGT